MLALLPFPDFGDCAAGGMDLVFESAAGVVEAPEVLRSGLEKSMPR
jgi:hypothetical protein